LGEDVGYEHAMPSGARATRPAMDYDSSRKVV
jgi:hypothetical protein